MFVLHLETTTHTSGAWLQGRHDNGHVFPYSEMGSSVLADGISLSEGLNEYLTRDLLASSQYV